MKIIQYYSILFIRVLSQNCCFWRDLVPFRPFGGHLLVEEDEARDEELDRLDLAANATELVRVLRRREDLSYLTAELKKLDIRRY